MVWKRKLSVTALHRYKFDSFFFLPCTALFGIFWWTLFVPNICSVHSLVDNDSTIFSNSTMNLCKYSCTLFNPANKKRHINAAIVLGRGLISEDNNNNNNHRHYHRANVSMQTANNETPFAKFQYSAIMNDKVQLPCDIEPASIDDQIVLVLWYKDDQLAPILTLDNRKNPLDQDAVQVSAPILRGRAHFNVHVRPAHLFIDPVTASDEGDYRCRVDFRKARTINTVISLKVIIPPQVPKIRDPNGNYLSGLVGPYNEGDELTLTCLTKGGKPRPSLIWWRDYAIIDDSFEYDDPDDTINELVITRLARHHLLALLMCQAVNSNLTVSTSNSITLDLNLKPSHVRITQLTPILVAGADALFECNTYGSRPMPIIYWMFDGNRFDTRIHGQQQTTSTITLHLERRNRGMILECVAENVHLANSAIRDRLILDIHYAPELELKLGASTLSLDSIQEGIDIYFDCHIDSYPSPTTPITWLFNGQPLASEPGVIESNQSLVLQRVPRWRNGTYQCKCSNQQGSRVSNAIELEIKFAPVCHIPYTLVYGVSMDETIQIECLVQAAPNNVTFQWIFEKDNYLGDFAVINRNKSILQYTARTRDQYGLIECIAKNSIGIQREPCRYLIVPFANPYFPFDCSVYNQSDSTIFIQCNGMSDMNIFSMPKNESRPVNGNLMEQGDEYNFVSSSITLANSQVRNENQQNLTASDIYGLYFAPELNNYHHQYNRQAQLQNNYNHSWMNEQNSNIITYADKDNTVNGNEMDYATGDHDQLIKMTYRNGIGSPFNNRSRLNASILFLNELVTKFNSHQLNGQQHLLVYPPTYYICEIFALFPKPILIKNITINAVERRIINPLNTSFAFLAEDLPANTPLKLNIYASNNRKRSLISVELNAQTLKPAQKRIDYNGNNNMKGQARESKSTWLFEEFYSNYSRFRNKHIVLGFIISTITIAIIIAILFITINILRSRNVQLRQQQSRFSNEIAQLKSDDNNELIILDHDNDDIDENENDERDCTWQYNKHKEKNGTNVLSCGKKGENGANNKHNGILTMYQTSMLNMNEQDTGTRQLGWLQTKPYDLTDDNAIKADNEQSLTSYYRKEKELLASEQYSKTYHSSNNKAYLSSNKFVLNDASLSSNIYVQEQATPDIIQTAIYSRSNVKCINNYEPKELPEYCPNRMPFSGREMCNSSMVSMCTSTVLLSKNESISVEPLIEKHKTDNSDNECLMNQ